MVLIFVQARRTVSAKRVGEGEFYCLYCNAERHYERRTWHQAAYLFWIWELKSTSGEFVICLHCGNTYDPECLDESSTAELSELLVEPPPATAQVARLTSRRGASAGRRH